MTTIVVHYKELALKGRNRPWFVHRLIRNIRTALAGLSVAAVRSVMGRIDIDIATDAGWDEVRERLGRIFGIANFARAQRTTRDFQAMATDILATLAGHDDVASFRVSARRADKQFPHTSPQIEREVGGLIKMARGWRVDLSHSALTIHIEVLPDHAVFFFEKEPGAGGLPTGSGGRVACLLSGGIDSPVAAYRMMRRGCTVLPIHFHSYPILSRASQDKVRQIVALLTRHQLNARLVLVPFGELQQHVLLNVPPPLRVVLYRRFMFRIAERIARGWRARALVTGEVIGQVASQTLTNLTTIAEATTLEVLRPLVGMDKDEIVMEAQRIGTLAVSQIPDQDCCQLFTPQHPSTAAALNEVLRVEQRLPVEELVRKTVESAVEERFQFPRAAVPTEARA